MGADISQFKQADLVKHMPDLAKLDEHGSREGGRKFVSKSNSITSFPHFSDYSMFPDRFNGGKSSPRAILGHSPPPIDGTVPILTFPTTVFIRTSLISLKKSSEITKELSLIAFQHLPD